MTEVIEQNQTEQESEVVEEEAQAGKETAVETATTETDAGLLEGKEGGLSIEDIMSDEETEELAPEKMQHGVEKKIGKEVGRRKKAEERASVAEKKVQELEAVRNAPTARPQVPLRENYETAEEYQSDFIKYEDDTVSFNNSQLAVNNNKARVEQDREVDGRRFQEQANRLRAKYPDFDALVTTDNPDGSNPFGGLSDLILSAENNAGLAYFLRKSPDKLDALNEMDRSKALLKIGEYSGRFNTVQKKTTNAPKTLNTIKEGSDTPVKNIYAIKSNNEFLKERNAEILRKRKQGG